MKSQVIRLSFAVCLCLMIATMAPEKREAVFNHPIEPAKRAELVAAYGKLPLRFEANRGQIAKPVKFISRNSGQTLFLTADEAVLELRNADFGLRTEGHWVDSTAERLNKSSIVRMKLIGANAQAKISPLDELPGKSNYFIGNDPSRWRTNVANFARVKYDGVYPGIDLVWHGDQRQLEHDFILAPGANPRQIRLSFSGAQKLHINKVGDLALQTEVGEVKLLKPVAWQELNGQRQPVECEFIINNKQQIGFRLGAYDRNRELVIDPVLLYSTYLGGNSLEQGLGVAVDKDFNAYVVGFTASTDFPGSSQIQPAIVQAFDAFVLKLNQTGTAVVYGTWLGGNNNDQAAAVAVDKDGNAYVTGNTFSDDFPKTPGALQQTKSGLNDSFITKINASGSALLYSSYIGGEGNDFITGLAVDATGNAYVAGRTESGDLPATGIQTNRRSHPVFKSTDRAANWGQVSSSLPVTQVLGVTIDPNIPAVLYAATFFGVYKTTNGGNQWQLTGQANRATAPLLAYGVVIDPSNPNTIYVVTRFNGLYKSTDGGQSYQTKNTGITFNGSAIVYDVAIDPQIPATIYTGTFNGVFKSVNGGDNWTAVNVGLGQFPSGQQPPRVNRLVIDPTNRMVIYAATNRGVFKTTDGGANWIFAGNGLGQGSPEVLTLAIDPLTPSTLYAGTANFAGGLFKTTDGGTTWRASSTGLNFPGRPDPLTVQSLAIDPLASMAVYAGTTSGGVYKSVDGGANWSPSNNGLMPMVINSVVVDRANPSNVYVGVNSGTEGFAAKINPTASAYSWLTYLGGTESDDLRAIAVDKDGNAYVTGLSSSRDFPTVNAFQATNVIGADAVLAKINTAGTALVYSTYFGGTSSDFALSIAVNEAGQAFIAGSTNSTNFPVKNPLQPALGGPTTTDAFVAKFNAAGSALEYSTWLGGISNDNATAIAIDSAGNAYVTGDTNSSNFPLVDAVRSQFQVVDAFVAKLNPSGSALVYSTYLGGSSTDIGNAIAVDLNGNAYIVGNTSSENFPTVNPLQTSLKNFADAFITKLGVDADLAIAKTVSRNPAQIANNFNFALAVTNNGPSPATGVVITDQLPAGINFVSATSSQGSCANNAGAVTCNVGNLAVRATATITLTASAVSAGTITNTASVKANEPDSVSANNQASTQVTVSTQPSIFGQVKLANGAPLASVAMTMAGALSANQQTNAQGFYQFANVLPSGNYTITPVSSAYSFEPAVRDFNLVTSDQSGDFVATPCTYALSPGNQSFEASGGSGTFTVTAQPRCTWTATTDFNWIKITSGANGAGNGSVGFTVEPTTAPRSGRIVVAGQVFAVWQGTDSCSSSVFRSKQYFYPFDPKIMLSADLNRDGLTDLLVGMRSSQSIPEIGESAYPINILFGEAGGRHFFRQAIFMRSEPVSIAVGDFNGDGNADVVSIGFRTEAEVFLNNGLGRFGSATRVSLTPKNSTDSAARVISADLNKDGKSDLIGITDSSSLMISLSNSSNASVAFGAPILVTLGNNFRGLADLNNDGVPDLVMSAGNFSTSGSLLVYPGDGEGSFGAPVTSTVSNQIVSSDFGDFNADGNLDIAVVLAISGPTGTLNNLSILYGDGRGKLGSQSFSTLPPFLFLPLNQMAVRDVNNDAKPDIIVLGINGGSILLGGSDGKLTSTIVPLRPPQAANIGQLAFGNFDASGKTVIAIVNFTDGGILILASSCLADGFAIYGRVEERPGQRGIGGVTMKLSGAKTGTTVTDSGGNYQFSGLQSGNYTVTPERPSTDILPAIASFNLTADVIMNFRGARRATAISAASFQGETIAPGSIASLFGFEMTSRTTIANQQPLPLLLGGVIVNFQNSIVGTRTARLFFVSPNQINILVPADLPTGVSTLEISSPGMFIEPVTSGLVQIEQVAPGLFSADASGRGLAAAVVLRVKADGSQVYESVTRFDQAQNKIVAVPIDVSNPAEQVFLLAFGTGISGRLALSNFQAKIGGEASEITFVGALNDFAGLDQLNLRLPGVLAGRGNVDVVLTVDGKAANTVQISIK